MKEIKNVLICGIGAIGSIYADIIQRFDDKSLRVLLDETRLKRYEENPIIFNGKELKFNYILPSANDYKADLIIIATKFEGLQDAITNIKNFVKDDTIIMSFLNGVTSEKIIAQTYGAEKLLYSYFIGHSGVRVGRNVTHDGVNTIVFGSANPIDKDNVQKVKQYFEKVGINYKIPEDILYAMWLKYMLNVSTNQTTAILGLNFGQVNSNPRCLDFVKEVMKEVQAIAKAEGIKNTENMIDDAMVSLSKMTPEGKTSMLQDVEAGRKTEVDMFAGVMIELGKKHNIPTPYNTVLKGLIDTIYAK